MMTTAAAMWIDLNKNGANTNQTVKSSATDTENVMYKWILHGHTHPLVFIDLFLFYLLLGLTTLNNSLIWYLRRIWFRQIVWFFVFIIQYTYGFKLIIITYFTPVKVIDTSVVCFLIVLKMLFRMKIEALNKLFFI